MRKDIHFVCCLGSFENLSGTMSKFIERGHTHIYTHARARACECTHRHIHTCTHIHIHARMHIRARMYKHTRTHTCAHIQSFDCFQVASRNTWRMRMDLESFLFYAVFLVLICRENKICTQLAKSGLSRL